MNLEVNGVQYTDFTSANCEIRLDTLSNSFNFTTAMTAGQALPFKGGDACKIIVDGQQVLSGYIEVISVSYDGTSHDIEISGRDKTGDLLDSTIGQLDDIRGEGLTLKSLIELVLKNIGLDILVIDEVSPKAFNAAEDIAAPEPGQNAFDFISQYAEKRQVLLTSNADGNIVIANNSGEVAPGAIQHVIGAEDNNVIASEFSFDTTGRYNSYKLSSELNPVALNNAGSTETSAIVNQSGGATDTEIRASRVLTLNSSVPLSITECIARATWEADVRKARGLIYSTQVREYRVAGQEGDLWQINKIYQIVDDFIGKIEPMLCNSVVYSLDVDGGRVTSLGFVGQKAYTLDLSENKVAEVANNVI